MGKMTVVERLLQHLDYHAGDFTRLLRMRGDTPAQAVEDYRSIIEEANGDLEADYYEIGTLVENIVGDLDSDEIFELGMGILQWKEKYQKRY